MSRFQVIVWVGNAVRFNRTGIPAAELAGVCKELGRDFPGGRIVVRSV